MEEKHQRIEERKEKEATTQATTAAEIHENIASSIDDGEEDIDGAEAKKSLKIEVHATATHHHEQVEPINSHAQNHEISHNQAVSLDQTCSKIPY